MNEEGLPNATGNVILIRGPVRYNITYRELQLGDELGIDMRQLMGDI